MEDSPISAQAQALSDENTLDSERSSPHLDAVDGLALAAVGGCDNGLVVVDGPAAADVVAELDQNLEGDRVRLHDLPADDPPVVGITAADPAAQNWVGCCDRKKGKQEGEANHAEKYARQSAAGSVTYT